MEHCLSLTNFERRALCWYAAELPEGGELSSTEHLTARASLARPRRCVARGKGTRGQSLFVSPARQCTSNLIWRQRGQRTRTEGPT